MKNPRKKKVAIAIILQSLILFQQVLLVKRNPAADYVIDKRQQYFVGGAKEWAWPSSNGEHLRTTRLAIAINGDYSTLRSAGQRRARVH
jgi:hypothetical protein